MLEFTEFDQAAARALFELAPDVVLTSQEGSLAVLEVAHDAGLPSILIVNHIERNAEELRRRARLADAVIAAAAYLGAAYEDLDPVVIPPPIDRARLTVPRRTPETVTMFNPVPAKGGEVFLRTAAGLPNLPFLAVEGWKDLGPFFQKCPLRNIEWVPYRTDPGPIFARTRVLIVPSLWPEPFGRVAAEAQVCGIPVIASARGGLPDTIGDGGIVIHEPEDSACWIAALAEVWRNRTTYEELSLASLRNSVRFDPARVVRTFLSTLSSVVNRNR